MSTMHLFFKLQFYMCVVYISGIKCVIYDSGSWNLYMVFAMYIFTIPFQVGV